MKILGIDSLKSLIFWSLLLGLLITYVPVIRQDYLYSKNVQGLAEYSNRPEIQKQVKEGLIIEPFPKPVVGYPLKVTFYEEPNRTKILILDFIIWSVVVFVILALYVNFRKKNNQVISKQT